MKFKMEIPQTEPYKGKQFIKKLKIFEKQTGNKSNVHSLFI